MTEYCVRRCFKLEAHLVGLFTKENLPVMKKIVTRAIFCVFAAGILVSQEKDPTSILKDFTRSTKMDGVNFTFTLLNDKTVELMFAGDSKYSMKARANQATTFYVQGISDKNVTLSNTFVVEQDGQKFNCSMINIENFQGGNIAKGQRVKGLLQLDKKLNLARPFIIKSSQNQMEFKLTDSVIKEL